MTILVTGAAGFIGFHLCQRLLKEGEEVIGIDNLNDYYEIGLKKSRLTQLKNNKGFKFLLIDITDKKKLNSALKPFAKKITKVVHLAAYAGVRYSIKNPYPYAETNLLGFLNILELCKEIPQFEHLIYASSSSVYGNDSKAPFSIDSPANKPISFYGATKKGGEIMAYCYSHLFGLPATGLRFFTVYGPWGRPDMAYFSFTKAIMEGKPINVFGKGNMKRDFTYIDDIVDGIMKCVSKKSSGHKVYNLGNSKTELLKDMIGVLEDAIGKKAKIKYQEVPAGDVDITYADIKDSTKDFGFKPKISIEDGLPRFVKWYKEYYK